MFLCLRVMLQGSGVVRLNGELGGAGVTEHVELDRTLSK